MSVFSLNSLLNTGANNTNGASNTHNIKPISAPSIASAAMLVEVVIKRWSAQKRDKDATARMLQQNNATKGAAKVDKYLMGECPELKELNSFLNSVRTFVYSATLPWTDTGIRLLTTTHHAKFHERITAIQQELGTYLDAFLGVYEWRLNEVEAQRADLGLGAMFRRDDYPTPDEVRSKFAIKVTYMPVPEAGDWRVDIGTEGSNALKEHYENYFTSREELLRQDIYKKFAEKVERLINSMDWTQGEKAKRMYNTTFDAVHELIDTMQDFNLTGDAGIETLRQQLAAVMDGVTLDALKNDHALRAEKKRQLENTINSLPGLHW